MTLKAFLASPDTSIHLNFCGFRRRLRLVMPGKEALSLEAWSGGGQTSSQNLERRDAVVRAGYNPVPTTRQVLSPFVGTSAQKIQVVDHLGKKRTVPKVRGGVIPPGTWIAVHKSAKEFRQPNQNLGQKKFETWYLKPWSVDAVSFAQRQLDTFYIHVTGYLGSDGCIVMTGGDLATLGKTLHGHPYVVLRTEVYNSHQVYDRDRTASIV